MKSFGRASEAGPGAQRPQAACLLPSPGAGQPAQGLEPPSGGVHHRQEAPADWALIEEATLPFK